MDKKLGRIYAEKTGKVFHGYTEIGTLRQNGNTYDAFPVHGPIRRAFVSKQDALDYIALAYNKDMH